MSFIKNVLVGFKDAVKAGSDFNPTLETVLGEIETLHQQGHLDQVLYQAEQSYVKEHEEYTAKGIHTNAADSQREVREMDHFIKALEATVDGLEPPLKEDAEKLLDLHDKMKNILGNAMKK